MICKLAPLLSTYNRGKLTEVPFSVHLFVEGEDEAQDKADEIRNYLLTHNNPTKGIIEVRNLRMYESDSGMARISKVIVEGTLLCKKAV